MIRSIVLRLVMPLLLASIVVAYLIVPHVDQLLAEWVRGDVELSGSLIASSVEDRLSTLVERGDIPGMRRYLSRVAADKHLAAILATCDATRSNTPATIATKTRIDTLPHSAASLRCAPHSTGAGEGTRTPTPLRETDFESAASTVPPLGPCAKGAS